MLERLIQKTDVDQFQPDESPQFLTITCPENVTENENLPVVVWIHGGSYEIGCGNLPISAYLEVPLSSIDQGTAELGDNASKLALSLVSSKTRPAPKSLLVQPKVVVRASTGTAA